MASDVVDDSVTSIPSLPPPPIDVLIVEDEKVSRRALACLLTACGFRPAACETAEEALDLLQAHPALPLILLDVDLPGMSGLELLVRLQSVRPNVRAIIVSAVNSKRVRRYRRPTVAYLRKPINPRRLLGLIDRLRQSQPGS